MFQPVSKPIYVTEALSSAEKSTITNSFSRLYSQQILVWAAQQKNKKRKQLMTFLSMQSQSNASPSRRSLPTAVKPNDLILKSLNSSINFNYSFRDRPCTRKINADRFSSHGIRDQGIFGYPEEYKTKPTNQSSYTVFIAKKLLTPEAAAKLTPFADDYFKLLKELQDWTERKANSTTASLYSEPESIRPTTQYAALRSKGAEDHVATTNVNYKSQNVEPEKLYHPPTTSYSDFFNREKQITSTKPFYPLERSVPFSRFATSSMGSRSCETFSISEENEIPENMNASKRFRSIFEAKTVL